ncbi:lytic transglycosylase domain-containing protein [Phreatobacter stygius]|uniref:Lytic transglycosylase domain-containing protein n=2 Tax=Pseudomonadota TaxID=1224 RepID=A0A4D7B3K6_9HYPH|nr:lytic transglycosylase domain-containing protein [Phreatobacter stygius]QCI68084.1 lytic transglycosylase domain-containing protein [Phreatobacter stygius]
MAPTAVFLPRLTFLTGVALGVLMLAGPALGQASDGDIAQHLLERRASEANDGETSIAEPAAAAQPIIEARATAPAVTGSIPQTERAWRPQGDNGGQVDVAALGRVIAAAKAGRVDQATAGRNALTDPISRAIAEWAILRSNEGVGFARLSAFLQANPGFPAAQRIRLRAEGALLEENIDGATVRAFYATRQPNSAKGKIALAIALKRGGDAERGNRLAREIWRRDDLSADTEQTLLTAFGPVLGAADHKARLDRMLHASQDGTAMRAAQRLGAGQVALARAFLAIGARRSNGGALLAQVPETLHRDPAYLFARAQWLRREDRAQEAAAILIGAPRDPALLGSPEDWWTERRVMVRKLLDAGDARTAYRVASTHSVREGSARVEAEFHCGWLALRFLNDPAAALRHFEAARHASHTPMSQSRAFYWVARAQEALGHQGEARRAYEAAARHPTHYYGQLARAKLGINDLPIRRPAEAAPVSGPSARALRMLYQLGEQDLARAILADLGLRAMDTGQLHAAAEVAARNNDAKGVLILGKLANNRGLPFDIHAFPTIGIPSYAHVGPEVDRAVVFAIARQESTFDPRAVSHAGARGLLQLMPATARATARTYGVAFDQGRLITDPAYNARIGAAHLGELVAEFNGSYIMTFAAYNAGRGRVREWVQAYGDPRDPRVDPIDWVERIPFTETRNYVQRVMENVQVYRARLGGGSGLRIEADLRRGRAN